MTSGLMRAGGPAAMLGGALFIAWAAIMASRPEGGAWGYRPVDDLGPLLVAGAPLLAIGWLAVFGRHEGRMGRLGTASLRLGLAATVLLGASGALMTVASDSWLMPFLAIPGWLLLIAGSTAFGISLVRARVLPRWMGACLLVATILVLAFNTEDWRALLFVPYGAAWIALGASLLSDVRPPSAGLATAS